MGKKPEESEIIPPSRRLESYSMRQTLNLLGLALLLTATAGSSNKGFYIKNLPADSKAKWVPTWVDETETVGVVRQRIEILLDQVLKTSKHSQKETKLVYHNV